MNFMSETDEDHEAVLADAAVLCRPRLFAIHGLYKRRENGSILGWGMQFPDGQGAVYTDPNTRTTHSTSTAENLLLHLRVGAADVELTWLSDATSRRGRTQRNRQSAHRLGQRCTL